MSAPWLPRFEPLQKKLRQTNGQFTRSRARGGNEAVAALLALPGKDKRPAGTATVRPCRNGGAGGVGRPWCPSSGPWLQGRWRFDWSCSSLCTRRCRLRCLHGASREVCPARWGEMGLAVRACGRCGAARGGAVRGGAAQCRWGHRPTGQLTTATRCAGCHQSQALPSASTKRADRSAQPRPPQSP